MCDYNKVMKELAEYKMLQEQTQAIIDGLTDQLKDYMKEQNVDVIIGDEHKASYKAVTAARIDTKALKADMPAIARRFCFL